MKQVGIVTINNPNYGNRLQNYAVQEELKKMHYETITIKNLVLLNKRDNFFKYVLKNIKHMYKKQDFKDKKARNDLFKKFDKNINFSKKTFNWFNTKWLKNFDFFLVGSDQVWNPKYRLTDFDLLNFTVDRKKIAFSASIGISELPEREKEKFSKSVKKFKMISVREDRGKEIVEELTGRTDVEVLVDPTMLLTAEEWDKVSKRPEQLKSDKKYILNYFLGKLSDARKAEIEKIAKENDCKIINILDKNDPFYETGPSEFLYLEKHAFLICTDSFHSSVFAILYNRPFVVFGREDNTVSMNSRIETLINKFNLKNREYNGVQITNENLNHDYSQAYEILEIERKKSKKFLEKALDIERTNNE